MWRQVVERTAAPRPSVVAAVVVLALTSCARSFDGPASASPAAPVNRLARESSPYLLQHAHNPVDWYPWGAEAFARAARERKLVFLSIGYSSCHWCHVMERESFENPEVAKLLNDWFVCIKVDREERPDIDAVYMTALQVLGQRGGWPLSLFLTADGKPIIGATYWPPDDVQNGGETRHGFKSILRIMHEWQTERPQKLQAQADRVADATRRALTATVPGRALIDLDRALVDAAIAGLRDEFDKDYGGFGSPGRGFRGPKFPVPSHLELLRHEARGTKAADTAAMLALTLDHMARGGIYDQLGGGFHRYSTERTWTVPHFEKMLYDNAQLVEIYARAYGQTPDPEYRRVVGETLAFVGRELTSPDGGFYSALDADSGGGEGAFYVWTAQELDAALPDRADATLVKKVYGADGTPNFEGKAYILTLPRPLPEAARERNQTVEALAARLAPLRQKLLAVRARRPRPFLDTKILTGWNGQMIAGYAAAGQALHEPKYLDTARRAAAFLLERLRTKDGRLRHVYSAAPGKLPEARLDGYLDDYAYLAHGLLGLHEATGERRWLDEARALTDTMVRLFADPEVGGFFYTSNEHEKLFARSKDQFDSAQPSGNSMAAANLVRLWVRTGDARYRDLAVKTFQAFAAPLKTNPTSLTALATALAGYLDAQGTKGREPAPAGEAVAQAGGVRKSDAVVKVTAQAEPEKPAAGGKQTVRVTFAIDSGWHIYANPPGLEDLATSQTTVTVSARAKPKEVKVDYPTGKVINDPTLGKYRVYEGRVTIKAAVVRAAGDTSPLEITAKFQACDERQCLLPATRKVTVPSKK